MTFAQNRWRALAFVAILAASGCGQDPQPNNTNTGVDVPVNTQDTSIKADVQTDTGKEDTTGTDKDTGATDQDTGSTDQDTGTTDQDTGTTDQDTGTTDQDTGSTDQDTSGCKADKDCPAATAPCKVAVCDTNSGTCSVKDAANNTPCTNPDVCVENASCDAGSCIGTAKVCDDKNPCTDDTCDAKTGCVFTNNAAQCNDGNSCTLDDTCAEGKCAAGKADTCDDGNPCTDNACDPEKGCQATNNTATCEDGNACTNGDVCAAGSCSPGKAADCDDKNACTVDTCEAKDGCKHAPAADGASCEDGNACTSGDACKAGVCAGAAVTCDDKNPCTADSCDKATGCVNKIDDTLPCDDDNTCTSADKCAAGVCKGTGKNCDDNNPCTDDDCANNVCSSKANVAPCDDGSACTQKDTCKDSKCTAGEAIPCDDKNPCTTDTCDSASGVCKFENNTQACDDGSKCTTTDTCKDGTCLGTPKKCDDGKACTLDSCDDASGDCKVANYADGTLCDDGTVCTQNDACKTGACSGTAITCDDSNPCTTDSCDTQAGCKYAANTAACEDGNKCTLKDTCKDNQCIAGATLDKCDDGNACTTDSCDASTGCKNDNNVLACTDGNACTDKDACKNGACAGSNVVCDDNNPCTDDSCDKAKGCVYTNNTVLCTDGSVCTSDDKCGGGKCVGATTIKCDDNNVCTTDTCDAKLGCLYKPVSAGATCNDGNGCTTGDKCDAGGKCIGVGKNCDDNNVCTTDSCAKDVCSNVPNTAPCNDGTVCTLSDLCDGKGKCIGSMPLKCDDGKVCTDDSCDKAAGCINANNAAPCDDGQFCTIKDTCKGGTCSVNAPNTCDDGNVCTNDACDAIGKKCVSTNNTANCDDGDKCTPTDKCALGKCVASKPIICDDLNPCTVDSCDKTKGTCVFTLTTDVAVCKVFTVPATSPVDFGDPLWVGTGGSGNVKWATDATPAIPGKLTGAASLNLNNGTGYADGGNAVKAIGLGKFFIDATAFKGTAMTAVFYSWMDVQEPDIDRGFVEFSADGFLTVPLSYQVPAGKAWSLQAFDLKSMIGKKFQVRFRFDSQDGIANAGAGWFVDQMNIYGGPVVKVINNGVYSEPFNDNNNGWQFDAANANNTGWAIDATADVGLAQLSDTSKSYLNFNNGVDFAGQSVGSSFSPVVDLTAISAGPVTLMFDEWFESEGIDQYDQRWVEVSGDAFVTLPVQAQRSNAGNLQKGWRKGWIDLSGLKGKKFVLRFRFNSGDTAGNNFKGWFLDNLRVDNVPAPSYAESITCANPSAFTIANYNAMGWAIDNNAGTSFYSSDCSLNLSGKQTSGAFNFVCPAGAQKVGGTAKTVAFKINASPTVGAKTFLKFKAYFGGESGTTFDVPKVNVKDTASAAQVEVLLDKNLITQKWGEISVDVTALAGKTVVITFSFDSGDCAVNEGAGIFVDDIMVRADK
jgi:hypothetical protein